MARESFSFHHFWSDFGIFENLFFACLAENNSNVIVVMEKQDKCDGGGGVKEK